MNVTATVGAVQVHCVPSKLWRQGTVHIGYIHVMYIHTLGCQHWPSASRSWLTAYPVLTCL